MSNLKKFILELISVGVLTMIIGFIIEAIYMYISKKKNINKRKNLKSLLFCLFITGVSIHFICQISGINNWYCKNGVSCQ
jgi:hypothetical protein